MTNDLTESVMEEAVKHEVNLIISYHPPIFAGLKRLTAKTWKERIIVQCLENKIALYSPHTAWDSCPDGVNDWLASSLPFSSKVPAMPSAIDPNFGGGRVCKVDGSLTLKEAIEKIKTYTGLPDVRVGISSSGSLDSPISSFGLCAGSGASVLKAIKAPIELFITGEPGHHEALDAISNNVSVITLNHSNSERGYLKDFKKILAGRLNDNSIDIIISEKDADPLSTY
jgi:dinuclear metal center YbgI/SA1388 family protein